jgi:hypothetical protein
MNLLRKAVGVNVKTAGATKGKKGTSNRAQAAASVLDLEHADSDADDFDNDARDMEQESKELERLDSKYTQCQEARCVGKYCKIDADGLHQHLTIGQQSAWARDLVCHCSQQSFTCRKADTL